MTKEYDLVVLGGGTGGYVAAIRASQLGMQVAIVEDQQLGGTCLHRGCIPSKALLRSAEMYRQMKDVEDFGIELDTYAFNLTNAQKRKDTIIHTLHEGVKALVKKAKVDVYEGFGRILGPSIFSPMPGTISIEHHDKEDNTMLVPKQVLIATGSKPRPLQGFDIDGIHILNSDDALQMKELPTSILIIGGGVIGVEWASMLQDLGVQVTVVESSEHILIDEDSDVRHEVKKELQRRGVKFLTGAKLDADSLKINDSFIDVNVEQEGQVQKVTVEKILVSIGREANINQIGLTNTNIQVKNNVIVTNDMYQTKESHIYAIGDCIGGMQLAHVAAAEGKIAVEHMAGLNPDPISKNQIPSCIYSSPEVGRVGLTEQEALEQGYQLKIGKFPFQAIGKAHVVGDAKGFAKIIVDKKTEDIIGIHMVGPQVTDMISEASLARMLDATAWEIAQTMHPHPTLSEIFSEAALAVEGLQIHG